QKLEVGLRERDEKLSAVLAGESALLDTERARVRALVASAKRANTAWPDTHDYVEGDTRDRFIDRLLEEVGWPLDQPRDREYEVGGMPNQKGKGYADYVLWGDDGKPLAVVEAKRTRKSPLAGQQQAKVYADCLEHRFGQRPIIFCTNGYEHWLWDDQSYPPRAVAGFFKKPALALMIERRTSRKSLAKAEIDETIVERCYQTRAVRRVVEAFERDGKRTALLAMATGAGKTRTVIALCDLLMKCSWAKRVLFLTDRAALVNQAVNAFKAHLPASSPVNLDTDRDAEGRVFVSTYPTMMGLIDASKDGLKRFGVGHFDLIVIDEAQREVHRKYGAIFDHFDSLLVGLTSTPKKDIDADTYRFFDLENGVPTDSYSLEDAVEDGYLLPFEAVSVPLELHRGGVPHNERTEAEKAEWDAIEWDEEGNPPDHADGGAIDRWLFDIDTVDKVLAHLMARGQKVAGGDRLGKTIIFARNKAHAELIAERFDASYPRHEGSFARVIHRNTSYAQTLIDDFSDASSEPHLAISVGTLDTGIDVPEVVNLVFFKVVRSKTRFRQMVGRGARLCKDLRGPGRDKELFFLLDYCGNLEFFGLTPPTTAGALGESLGKRLFEARLSLIGELDHQSSPAPSELRDDLATLLHAEVEAMNLDNFLVRPKRRLVEKYARPDAWVVLPAEARDELSREVAGLSSELPTEDEEARRFDLLILKLQLAVVRREPALERWREQVKAIAALLEEKTSAPPEKPQLALIHEIQSEAWWQSVTPPSLEHARKQLRALVKLIDKAKRAPIYSSFEDEIGADAEIAGTSPAADGRRAPAEAATSRSPGASSTGA
ncbi:MAG: DEAD/DEAH box helicase family protein, partial [Byssovorax sp.]